MLLAIGAEQIEANPTNASFFRYDNDMLNGLYVDIGQQYLFVSEHFPHYPRVREIGMAEGIEEVQYGSPDLEEAPHCWIINSLGGLVVLAAEAELDQYGNH